MSQLHPVRLEADPNVVGKRYREFSLFPSLNKCFYYVKPYYIPVAILIVLRPLRPGN